jgi:hypothetical protein
MAQQTIGKPHSQNWLRQPGGKLYDATPEVVIATTPTQGGSGSIGMKLAREVLQRLDECGLEVKEKRGG